MNTNDLKKSFVNATKWSIITEACAKIVGPITNMILARIISPEAFGVVATITMIMSFADMLTDAGFQNYLIQKDFNDESHLFQNANVAFWTNLSISIFLWIIIIIYRNELSQIVGNPGLGNVLAIASVQLILTSFSSIQMAIYKRQFDFKTLFMVRIITISMPIVITVPLALLGYSYWSLIVGNIVMQLSNAVILTLKSKWKPSFFYKISILKEMFSFSIWSLIESISIWITTWIDIFIIGTTFNPYYLGLYKTSQSMVTSIMSIITASTKNVLFVTLSRLKSNKTEFNNLFLKSQRLISILVFPLGVGIFLFSSLATSLLLGKGWEEASRIIGIYSLTQALIIVLGYYCSEVYRAKGRPKLSFLAQVLYLIVLVPCCIISSQKGFWIFVYARSISIVIFALIHLIIMKYKIKINITKILANIMPTAISSIAMGIIGYVLKQFNIGILWDFISIFICSISYFSILYLFPSMRADMKSVAIRIKARLIKGKFSKIQVREN